MTTIDARCLCKECQDRTERIYRMVGYCSNCGAKDLLIIYRAGDKTRDLECPSCECSYTVRGYNQSKAADHEIPAA